MRQLMYSVLLLSMMIFTACTTAEDQATAIPPTTATQSSTATPALTATATPYVFSVNGTQYTYVPPTPTHTPTWIPATIEQVRAYFMAHPITEYTDLIAVDEFPLRLLTVRDFGLPEVFTGYDIEILDVMLLVDEQMVAINYQYDKGGSNVYAQRYGQDTTYYLTLVYELVPNAVCDVDIDALTTDFQVEDGTYVLSVANEVLLLADYQAQYC